MQPVQKLMRFGFNLCPQPLRHFIRDRLPAELARRILQNLSDKDVARFHGARARKLESKLWGGFSEQALLDLEAMKADPSMDARNASYAALALARWYWVKQDVERSLENAVLCRSLYAAKGRELKQCLLEVDCLIKLGRQEEARELVRQHIERRGEDRHLVLAMANTYTDFDSSTGGEDDAARLEWINKLFQAEGLRPIARMREEAPLHLDNLTAKAGRTPAGDDVQSMVTVIVPAYNAEGTLPVALEGLLAQTWRNLEILVVDDVSSDSTRDVVLSYAQRDNRVRLLPRAENGGAYAARNTGLAEARGDFITIHDSDDWSHPQKIEIQARHLLENPDVPANGSYWVRVHPHLYFRGTSRPSGQLIQWNHSSLMLRRSLMETLGGWDNVRVAADSELIRRLEAYTGASVERLLPAAPLSFALEDPTSLTRTGATHAYTMFHGVRRQYHEAARHWLETTPPEEIPNAFRGESRPFPAPGLITKERRKSSQLDVLIVTDFNVQGGAYVSTMNYVRAALRAGLRVGLFQWRRYNLDAAKSLNPEVLSLAQTGAVELVTPGEEVHAQYVIVGYPVVLQHVIDMPPQLDCDHFLIVTNQFASRLTDGGDWQYEPSTISANVRRLFGKTPTWAPISGRVRELMLADGRYGPLHDQDWVPLIDTELWCARPLEWRGASRARPVVGRHGRDHYTKWPAEAGALKAAYCVGKPCEVRLLGGAAHAESMLGGRPSNWRVQDYGAMPAMEFLPELDFYVHYPHELYIEEFGRAVMEAMAMGIPAVLPPVFRSTFGEAAVYAEPGDVWDVVDTLWHDEQAYLQRARSGRDFVMRHCGHSRFSERLAAMETRPPSDAFDAQGS